MGEWKEYKLGDLADITSSKRIFFSEYVQDGVPFYRSKEIIDLFNRRDIQTEHFITEKKYNEINDRFGVPECNDILLTSVGSLGIPYKVKPGDRFYFKDGNLTWFRSINQDLILPNFLYTWINSHIGKQKLDEIAIGSTQAALTISGLKSIDILLPDINTQQSIAEVLSSLDDKIDLLHRQNKTLEQLAETLFRQWFVEEADESWEVGTISTIIEIQSGFAFKSTEFVEQGRYKLITIKNVQNGYLDLSKTDKLYQLPNRMPHYCLLNEGDILLSLTGNVGRCCLVEESNLLLNQRVANLRPRIDRDWAFTYIMFRRNSMRKTLEELAKGTAQANLSPIETGNIEIQIPPENLLSKYSDIATPMITNVLQNKIQIRTLTQLREILLPKLMSGESIIRL